MDFCQILQDVSPQGSSAFLKFDWFYVINLSKDVTMGRVPKHGVQSVGSERSKGGEGGGCV